MLTDLFYNSILFYTFSTIYLFLDRFRKCLKLLGDIYGLEGVEHSYSFDELLFDLDSETCIFCLLLFTLPSLYYLACRHLFRLICFNVSIFQSSKFWLFISSFR